MKRKIVTLKESDLVRIVKRVLSEQAESRPATSTENTRKLSDIDPTIFIGSNINVGTDAEAISQNLKLGIPSLRLFGLVANKIYELNKSKNKLDLPITSLYMNGSGDRFKNLVQLILPNDAPIKMGNAEKQTYKVADTPYSVLKKGLANNNDNTMASLYDKWLTTKLS